MQQITKLCLHFISQGAAIALGRRKIQSETKQPFQHSGGAERQRGRKQQVGFVGKTLGTLWPQISSVSLKHDWGLIFKCNSKQHK